MVERFRDELGDWRVVVHSPVRRAGARAVGAGHRGPAARAVRRMDVQAMHADDGIVLRRARHDDEPPPDRGSRCSTRTRSSDRHRRGRRLARCSPSRFRECAGRALLLPRRDPGRRTPLWQQRQRSAQLLEVASQYAAFPIVLETMRECLQDVFDVPGAGRG